ncbi:helix-turn-helix domain-containing protein [Kitasatospora sp. NPDC051984]|uniref:helix-turn-helix domain-containing protein n=1 Tax=Kitasatospora sp. NPDC051984 TaxID=3364059 RepID=UPI0037C81321
MVAAVVLSATLRSLRIGRGMKQGDVARDTRMSASKLCKLENGDLLPQRQDVDLLAGVYGVSPGQRTWLGMLTDLARQPPEWQQSGITVPFFMCQLVGLEPAAERLWTYEADLVPGLFQTEAYMRAVMARSQPALGPGEIEERIEVRRYRQDRLFSEVPDCIAVFDESILWRRIGSRETMVEQLERLINITWIPQVQIRIVPLDGEHQVLTNVCSLTQLEFGQGSTGLPSVIYLETDEQSKYFVKGERARGNVPSYERYAATLLKLMADAADRPKSRKILEEARQRFAR